jgi:hypothetical protein
MKKWLPYIFLGGALIAMIFLMNGMHHREELGMKLTHPRLLLNGVLFVVLTTIGIALLMKRF